MAAIKRRLSVAGIAALALTSIPAVAEPTMVAQGKAEELGVMSVNLKDAVKFNWGFQGALQGAMTPNQAGIGGFIPLSIGGNGVLYLDSLANYNIDDYTSYTSLGEGPRVQGGTISTSSRLGYRWLNGDRSWMFGINAGYDSRPTNIGSTDVQLADGTMGDYQDSIFYQQVALNVEAVSNKWFFSGYWLLPIGKYGYGTNVEDLSRDDPFSTIDSLMTIGGDIGYNVTPRLKFSLGYYYSEGAVLKASDGNSFRGKLEYSIANGLTTGLNLTYDPGSHIAWPSEDLSLSANIKYRFGANGYGSPSLKKQKPQLTPVLQALSTSPSNRDVLVHDFGGCLGDNYDPSRGRWRGQFWSWNCDAGISEEFGAFKNSTWNPIYYGGWASYSRIYSVHGYMTNGQSMSVDVIRVLGARNSPKKNMQGRDIAGTSNAGICERQGVSC